MPTKLTLEYDLNEISGLKAHRVFFCNGKIVDLSEEERKLFTFSTVTVDDRFFTVDYVFHAQLTFKAGKKPHEIQVKDPISAPFKILKREREQVISSEEF